MTTDLDNAVELVIENLEYGPNVGDSHHAGWEEIAKDAVRVIRALSSANARAKVAEEMARELVDALGQATGLLMACEDDIDIDVVVSIRDGEGNIVRKLADLHSPTIIENGSALLKRARSLLAKLEVRG